MKGIFISFILMALYSCSLKEPAPSATHIDEKSDLFEDWNRSVLAFNQFLDDIFFFPIMTFYIQIIPDFLRIGVHNVIGTLNEPLSMANSFLQLDSEKFFVHTARFFVNVLFGFAGLVDTATELGLCAEPETFAQTLRLMGVPMGSFIMLPILGPTTMRDSIARVLSYFTHPIYWVSRGQTLYYSLYFLDQKATYWGTQAQIYKNFSDPYIIIRDAYYQSHGQEEVHKKNESVFDTEDNMHQKENSVDEAKPNKAESTLKAAEDIFDTAESLQDNIFDEA